MTSDLLTVPTNFRKVVLDQCQVTDCTVCQFWMTKACILCKTGMVVHPTDQTCVTGCPMDKFHLKGACLLVCPIEYYKLQTATIN